MNKNLFVSTDLQRNVPYHRCTRVENPGDGVSQIFAKIPGVRGQGFPDNFPRGYPGFLHFY